MILLLLVLAVFFALSEISIARISRVKAHQLLQDEKQGADALLEIVEDPAPHLNAVLFLTLLSHIGATAIATGMAIERYGFGAEAVSTGVMTLLVFILAEVTPKTFAVQRTEPVALFVARPIRFLGRIFGPLSKVLIWTANLIGMLIPGSQRMPKGPFVTEDEIRQMVEIAEEEEEIEGEERELIHSVFEFGTRSCAK